MKNKRLTVGMTLALLLGAVLPSFAQVPAYPAKPIRLMVGYPAGGGVDAMARLLAPRLSATLGQPIVVDNRAGAAGVIAADVVAKAAPDGYTIFLGDSSTLIAQYMQPHLPFDPIKSFTPVAGVFKLPLMIVTSNSVPAKTPQELIALLKASPGKYSYATPGVGTVQHLGFEMFKGKSGAFVVHIPYRGAAQIVPDVISGQVPLAVLSMTAAMAQSKAGRLRALTIMSPDKVAGAEGIPALADLIPGFDAAPRIFLLAPARTPPAIIERLNEAVRIAMASADMPAVAAQQGAVPAFLKSPSLAQTLVEESNRWRTVIREQKITSE